MTFGLASRPFAAFAIVSLCVISMPIYCQGPLAQSRIRTEGVAGHNPLKFAVVSIKQNRTGGQQRFGEVTPDGWRMTNMFLAAPILTAYVPQASGAAMYSDNQVVGLAAWLVGDDNDRYDIDAKVDDADLADWQNPGKRPAMLRAMLQAMLADRLKLVVHRSTKDAPAYSLVVGKNGPKFSEAKPDVQHPGAYPFPGGGMLAMERKDDEITVHYFGITMGQVITMLLGSAGRPVEDKTGLTGKYDTTIEKPVPVSQEPGVQPGAAPDLQPSAFSMAEQLGLKLEPAMGQVERLVIDHVERPSPN